jgi:hypothetical protein
MTATRAKGKKPVTKIAWKKRENPINLTGATPVRTVKRPERKSMANMSFLKLNLSTQKPHKTALPFSSE